MQCGGNGFGAKTSFTPSKRRLSGLPVTKHSMGFRIAARSRAAIARHRPIGLDSPGSTNGARSRRLQKGGLNETFQSKRVQARKSARVSSAGGDAALRHAG